MSYYKEQAWGEEIGRVFNTRPRDGTLQTTVWQERKELEKLINLLVQPGIHVCVDGPTGTGKSSLVTTALSKLRKKHIPVKVTHHMSWQEFCRRLVTPQAGLAASADIEFGFKGPLPEAKFRITLKPATDKSVEQVRSEAAQFWSEQDVCDALCERDAILFIDDFERATDSLVIRVVDLIKSLTQIDSKSNAKVVVVGTDDVYARLLHAHVALEDRLLELSVGTFPNRIDSTTFIAEGFRKLHLIDPWTNPYVTPEERQRCSNLIFDAADGLPKSLNQLGYDICKDREPRRRNITLVDVQKHSDLMLNRHVKANISKVPEVIRMLRSNTEVRLTLYALYESGIGQALDWHLLMGKLGTTLDLEQIEAAVSELVRVGILTQTGANRAVLYSKDPMFLHTLSVIVRDPVRCGFPEELFGRQGQLSLPLGPT